MLQENISVSNDDALVDPFVMNTSVSSPYNLCLRCRKREVINFHRDETEQQGCVHTFSLRSIMEKQNRSPTLKKEKKNKNKLRYLQ